MIDKKPCEYRLKPFLKWAGGKRWLVSKYSSYIPDNFNRYIEPFLGSGAVYFYLKPKNALLGDINFELIETYKAIKENWYKVYSLLSIYGKKHSKDFYYQMRANKPSSRIELAAWFIYLNRTCWNGLYRVNKEGVFNVPKGTKRKVIYEDDDFCEISNILQNTELLNVDFESLISRAKKGDLIYVDPPYTVRHNNNSFIKYNENLFSWLDQERLSFSLSKAIRRGALVIASNAFNQNILDLYGEEFYKLKINRPSLISSKRESRNQIDELLLLSH